MDLFNACGIIEGFTNENPTTQETLTAWSYLIKSGDVWSLQGTYGRTAHSLIEQGIIDSEGDIHYENLDEAQEELQND